MKMLIALLTAATGILHLLVGFNVIPGSGVTTTSWLLVLNGVGYLVLLVLFWTASGSRRGTIRWILLAYTLITLIGYFVINAGDNYGLNNSVGLLIKAIELLNVILLLMYRPVERVARPATGAAASRGVTGMDSMRMSTPSVTTPSVTTTMGSTAAGAAAGISTGAAAVAAGAIAMGDRATDATEDAMDAAGDTMHEAVDDTGDLASGVADRAGDAVDAAGDTMAEAVDDVGDVTSDVVDRAGDAVDALGDEAGDAADAMSDAVDATGDALHGGVVAVVAAADATSDKVQDVMDTDAAELDAADLAAEPTEEDLRTELEEYLRSLGPSSEFRKDIEYIEGIGAVYGQKLRGVGVNTVLDLMVNGATRRGRKHLADQSGISASMILTWVNHVDLFRIKGVAQEYADLLEQSGVDTVVELAQRNPANLHKRMLDINEQKALVRRAPHASEVQSWVEQAKNLRRLIHY